LEEEEEKNPKNLSQEEKVLRYLKRKQFILSKMPFLLLTVFDVVVF